MILEFTLEQSIQTVLGLPELNKTETRRNLGKIFAAYRRCKLIIKMGIKSEVTRVVHEPLPGYENAADPDKIHAPFGTGGGIPIGPEERFYRTARHFVWEVDRKVDMLPDVKREIIKRRFLALDDRLPSDSEVMYQLDSLNFGVSERDYYRKKKEAMMVLAYAFGVEVDE